MVAINVALEVDLTGQVCADSLGDAVLLRHRRAGRLQPRRAPLAGRQGHHRPALDGPGRHGLADRRPAEPGRRRGHHPRRRPLRRHRVRRRLPARQERPGTGPGPDLHRPSRLPRTAPAGGHRGRSTSAPEMREVEGKIRRRPPEHADEHAPGRRHADQLPPIHPTDEPRMRDLFYALSQETIYYRFMTPHEAVPAEADPGFRLHRPPQATSPSSARCPRPTARRSSPSAATT